MGHIGKNGSHLKNRFPLGKMGDTLKKWVTLRKMRLTLINESHLEKWPTLKNQDST